MSDDNDEKGKTDRLDLKTSWGVMFQGLNALLAATVGFLLSETIIHLAIVYLENVLHIVCHPMVHSASTLANGALVMALVIRVFIEEIKGHRVALSEKQGINSAAQKSAEMQVSSNAIGQSGQALDDNIATKYRGQPPLDEEIAVTRMDN